MRNDTRRALFLDRDGVINVDIGYPHLPEDCVFVDGIFELVRRAGKAGYDVFVVTNQAGIARGFYSEATFAAFTAWLLQRFAAEGAFITQVYHCPHHPTAGLGEYLMACACRKPAPGMLLAAQREHAIDMARSAMIGDSATDMAAAASAGVGTRYLLGSAAPSEGEECVRIASLYDAIGRLGI
ncbi:D,D-heptose 1,7-bisphosphate phosphatase [Burkholderia pseudomallei]|uniref:D,D-heptose 1,7-bisphosphate phosphatase n=1 Tax=Burkholderia pseudomallei TaxID=28450 RepID=D5KLC9_BURPE|nr:HAD family hydrolase [Burkholderia pseudomallei]ADE44326.1 putative D-alpha,beta-D-heptose 1,7-bisphosphate phosphatase [Burkholderia pseudomallei]ADQ27808.1 putative d-alpha,beta-d-heptose 17-bisphosphate phosphatase [Burkholderia pseudomallei]ADQ27830.1 putative d-alpha,beta-d-heptose 17-bisphosphate phosphatase [Burkholderia pseudomallei]AJX70978.1 D,D-heptose 1,7-bisphosphate phosphatase family protein [Burkholderia pseudomallei MSHR840]KIX45080.1 D,D-heptose 1,7-bisphosphate phosphatas